VKCPALVLVVSGLAACDASVTVGYNDRDALQGGSVTPESCPDDALFRACTTETCVVSEIAAPQFGKETIVVDADYLYFVSDPDVLTRMPKGGGDIVPLANVSGQLQRMTLDADYVYWTVYNGEIFRVPKGGGETTVVAELFGHPFAIASHEGDLYTAMTETGEVAKVTKSSGASTRITGQSGPADLALDGEYVYWINQGEPGAETGELVRAPLGNLSAAEVILSNLEEPLVLGVTPDAILWATYEKVFRLAREGGEPQVFEIPFDEPKGVIEFDGFIYAAGYGLYRIRLSDGESELLDGRGFTAITLGCDALYGVGWYDPILIRYGR
jgi:hypothetical protein